MLCSNETVLFRNLDDDDVNNWADLHKAGVAIASTLGSLLIVAGFVTFFGWLHQKGDIQTLHSPYLS